MESLRNLEQVHRMLAVLHHHGLASGHSHSDRFLSEFLLFMVQSCGALSMEGKCGILSKTLLRMPIAILEEAKGIVTNECESSGPSKDGRDSICLVGSPQGSCKIQPQKNVCHEVRLCPLETNFENEAIIGLNAMERANSTLEDFCRTYFMFHGMDVSDPATLFKYLPILSFTEGYIYQLDAMNEKILNLSANGDLTSLENGNLGSAKLFVEAFQSDPFQHLCNLFDSYGILTERLKEELNHGSEYWSLERKLCHQLTARKEISVEEAMRAIHLKSFDYRVLNLLLYHLRKEPVNEEHMEFLSVSEFLVEISDDLYDYEDDVLENNFNILRMFVGLYGASETPRMLARCISRAEEKHKRLSEKLDPMLSQLYWKRCEEATREGGNASDRKLGSWNIPQNVVLLEILILISNFKLSYKFLRHPDGTFNLRLAEFLDSKSPPPFTRKTASSPTTSSSHAPPHSSATSTAPPAAPPTERRQSSHSSSTRSRRSRPLSSSSSAAAASPIPPPAQTSTKPSASASASASSPSVAPSSSPSTTAARRNTGSLPPTTSSRALSSLTVWTQNQ